MHPLWWKFDFLRSYNFAWLLWWLNGKESACQCRKNAFDPWVRKIPLEEEVATHSSILAWEIPWTEEPSKLYSPRGRKLSVCACTHAIFPTDDDEGRIQTHRKSRRRVKFRTPSLAREWILCQTFKMCYFPGNVAYKGKKKKTPTGCAWLLYLWLKRQSSKSQITYFQSFTR